MAKEILQLGNAANDGTGDSLRAGGTKLNANFTELYDALGGTSGSQNNLVSTASPNVGDALTWNGSVFSPARPANKNILEENLNVNGFNIVSSSNGNILLQSDGTGDIIFEMVLTAPTQSLMVLTDFQMECTIHLHPTSSLEHTLACLPMLLM